MYLIELLIQVLDFIDRQFQGSDLTLNSRRGREWAPRSPDLTPLDYFLWGYLKSKVYVPRPANINELKRRITTEFNSIPADMIRWAVQDIVPRSQPTMCRDQQWWFYRVNVAQLCQRIHRCLYPAFLLMLCYIV